MLSRNRRSSAKTSGSAPASASIPGSLMCRSLIGADPDDGLVSSRCPGDLPRSTRVHWPMGAPTRTKGWLIGLAVCRRHTIRRWSVRLPGVVVVGELHDVGRQLAGGERLDAHRLEH